MKPQTAAMKEMLAGMGLRGVRVRTDRTLQWTSATLLEPAQIAVIDERAEALAAEGYGVEVHRLPSGGYSHAVVTTDRRRAGKVSRPAAPALAALPA